MLRGAFKFFTAVFQKSVALMEIGKGFFLMSCLPGFMLTTRALDRVHGGMVVEMRAEIRLHARRIHS